MSIDILVNEDGEKKVYRAWGGGIHYQGKHIRFKEFKERLKPFLDTIPKKPALFYELQKHNQGMSYFLLFTGVLILTSTVFLFILMANGGRVVPEIGLLGMIGLTLIGISQKLAKPKPKPKGEG